MHSPARPLPGGAQRCREIHHCNLLPRFYDVTDGAILIDDHDIRDVTVASLREQVGIVPQETNLFNDTVYNNILYGRLDAPGGSHRRGQSRQCG